MLLLLLLWSWNIPTAQVVLLQESSHQRQSHKNACAYARHRTQQQQRKWSENVSSFVISVFPLPSTRPSRAGWDDDGIQGGKRHCMNRFCHHGDFRRLLRFNSSNNNNNNLDAQRPICFSMYSSSSSSCVGCFSLVAELLKETICPTRSRTFIGSIYYFWVCRRACLGWERRMIQRQ